MNQIQSDPPPDATRFPVYYRRFTQHRIPLFPRNQHAPMNRNTDNPAVAYRITSK